jgi:hypothetical protein
MSDTNPNPSPNANEPAAGSADPQTKQERTFSEEFRVSGEAVISKVKELVREGNVRRITIKNEEGRTLIEIPLTIGVIGTVLLPVWAAIGAVAALVANLTIGGERVRPVEPSPGSDVQPPTGPGPV